MARPGITRQEVFTAAKLLVEENKYPTIELIRQITKTGSHSTIGMHLRDWRATQSDAQALALAEGLPQELVATLKTLWQRVSAIAQQEKEAAEIKSQADIETLEQELQKYKANNQRWQQLYNQWQLEKEQLATDKQSLAQSVQSLQREMEALQIKYQNQTEQLQEKQNRVEELIRLHDNAQANLEHYRESVREQRLLEQEQQNQLRLEAAQEIKTLKEQLIIMRDRADKAEHQYHALHKEHTQLTAEADKQRSALDAQQQKLMDISIESAKQNEAALHWQTQYHAQIKINDENVSKLIENQLQVKMLAKDLYDKEETIANLQQLNSKLVQDQNQMEQSNAHLKGQLQQMQRIVTA